ncbi:PIN domain-containing protein [Marinobacter sp. F4216]|uniref:PIN domain-containing protein n=1 Tax=Marinobacter sp. F4216 TaxID=2874281 RepID=UPI001CBB614D|nr:PIN domain-containing protein [Marinobacter sp. F4216]MBZ2169330.1 PIN domain-containing protein [Marinobacter sp. F4216]
MNLETRKVFVDTQSFIKLGLNFSHPALLSFGRLCSNGSLMHLSTSVVQREVEAKIISSVEDGLASLRSFRRKAKLLEKIEDEKVKGLFVDIDEKEAISNGLEVFHKFINFSNTDVISIGNVNPDDVFNLYFETQPPFGNGKKKSEFPDAFSIYAILGEVGDDKVYVVSDDGDLKSLCSIHDNLISVETLERLLDIYNVHESAVADAIKTYMASVETDIKESIESAINDSWGYNEAPWEDSEVEELQAMMVHDFEPLVVRVDEDECLVTFDVDVDLDYTVYGPDFLNGVYNSEEGHMWAFDTTSHSGSATRTFTVEMKYSYSIRDEKVDDIDQIDFSVVGLSDGIPVYVDEQG